MGNLWSSFLAIFPDGFWWNFAANALATFLGILVGVPIALLIERKRAKKEEEVEKRRAAKGEEAEKKRTQEAVESKQAEVRARTQKILNLLKGELQENKNSISKIHVEVSRYFEPIKTELWRAFSDGGELQWINDPDLIDAVADAYGEIKHFSLLYRQYFQNYMFQGTENNLGIAKILFEQVFKTSESCKKSIDTALLAIQNKLKALSEDKK